MMTFEEFKQKADAIYSKITSEELAAQLEELGYPIECFEKEPKDERYFSVDFEASFDNGCPDNYLPLAA